VITNAWWLSVLMLWIILLTTCTSHCNIDTSQRCTHFVVVLIKILYLNKLSVSFVNGVFKIVLHDFNLCSYDLSALKFDNPVKELSYFKVSVHRVQLWLQICAPSYIIFYWLSICVMLSNETSWHKQPLQGHIYF